MNDNTPEAGATDVANEHSTSRKDAGRIADQDPPVKQLQVTDRRAPPVLPTTGWTAWLTMLSAGVMCLHATRRQGDLLPAWLQIALPPSGVQTLRALRQFVSSARAKV